MVKDYLISLLIIWKYEKSTSQITPQSQAYDNDANMRDKHNGLRKKKKNMETNSKAFFASWGAHSVNSVVNDATKISFETVHSFGTVQELYSFFSIPIKHTATLKKHILKLNLKLFLIQDGKVG